MKFVLSGGFCLVVASAFLLGLLLPSASGVPLDGNVATDQPSTTIKPSSSSEEDPDENDNYMWPSPPQCVEMTMPEEDYSRLRKLYSNVNDTLSADEQMKQIADIMRKVPKDLLRRLPLDYEFKTLPKKYRAQAQDILYDYSIDRKTRDRKIFEFFLGLKPKYRGGLMSYETLPGKTAFASINSDVYQNISAFLSNDTEVGSLPELEHKFWTMVDQIPLHTVEHDVIAVHEIFGGPAAKPVFGFGGPQEPMPMQPPPPPMDPYQKQQSAEAENGSLGSGSGSGSGSSEGGGGEGAPNSLD